ncbi:hypothetical protein B6U66_04535 [Candidatus Bathyarchaeota archaeon ex4484_135]|nr:MAG: hypothetical protein B6U66_04535 [Candidatus Bathyarchaeota archaeon ex4484_135]
MSGQEGPVIIADVRENRLVILELKRLGARVEEKAISPGDYVVGEAFGIERKSMRDFIQSIFKKRLFEQVERLRQAYPRCCLVVEGDPMKIAALPNPSVFWGALARLITDAEVPVIFTPDEAHTALFLYALAKKLQEEGEKVEARYKPKMMGLRERQRFVVEGLPGVGPKLADRLLRVFGSVRAVFNAPETALAKVKGVGPKRAREIRAVIDAPYPGQARLDELGDRS